MHYPLVANDGQQYGVLKKRHTHIHHIKSDCDSRPKDPILMLGYMSLKRFCSFSVILENNSAQRSRFMVI